MPSLTIHHEKRGSVDVINLEGILNADTCHAFDEVLKPVAGSQHPRILMDLPDLTYISSAGIGSFIDVIRDVRQKGGDIRFCRMGPKVKRVFDLLDMDDFFSFFESFDEALGSYDAS